MHPGLKYIPLIMVGLAAIGWGLPAAHRLARPLDIGAALAVLAGVLLLTVAILLTFVPGFFG
jgi:hypothetical protein